MALLIGAVSLSAIICIPSLVLVLVWCSITARNRQSKQEKTLSDDSTLQAVNPSNLASGHSYTYNRHEPDPIYDVPSWSTDSDNSKTRSSMMYNGVYQGGFVMSRNVAYRDEFNMNENNAYDNMSKVKSHRDSIEMSDNRAYCDCLAINGDKGYKENFDMSGNSAYSTSYSTTLSHYEQSHTFQ